jgi:pimeloyl-ACP methyl ester carboxylesterase
MKTTRIDIGPVTLSVTEHGEASAPPVVLLHGFPEHAGSWRYQLPALADAGFRAIAPDLRGFRASDKPVGYEHYDLATLAADVRSLLDTLGLERADVVGHDWGGVIAWAFAETYPERLRRLVILDAPHPHLFAKQALRSPRQLLRSSYIFFFQLPGLAERMIRRPATIAKTFRGWSHHPAVFDDETLAGYVEAMNRPGAATATLSYYRAALRGVLGKSFAGGRARRIEAPTLVLWGDDDRALGSELLDGLHDVVADLRILRIPDASHWVQQDQPERVNDAILTFLTRP